MLITIMENTFRSNMSLFRFFIQFLNENKYRLTNNIEGTGKTLQLRKLSRIVHALRDMTVIIGWSHSFSFCTNY